jgi:hypothetical protein
MLLSLPHISNLTSVKRITILLCILATRYQLHFVKLETVTIVSMKRNIFRYVTLCSLMPIYTYDSEGHTACTFRSKNMQKTNKEETRSNQGCSSLITESQVFWKSITACLLSYSTPIFLKYQKNAESLISSRSILLQFTLMILSNFKNSIFRDITLCTPRRQTSS